MRKDESEKSIKIPTVSYAELIADNDVVSVSIIQSNGHLIYGLNRDQYLDVIDLEKGLSTHSQAFGHSRIKLVADRSIPMAEVNKVKVALQKQQFYEMDYLVIQY